MGVKAEMIDEVIRHRGKNLTEGRMGYSQIPFVEAKISERKNNSYKIEVHYLDRITFEDGYGEGILVSPKR